MQTSGMHNNYVDVRTDAPTGTCGLQSVHRYGLYVLPLIPQNMATALHYDSNAPLLGHLIDAGAMGRQIEDDIAICMYIHLHGWPQLGLLT